MTRNDVHTHPTLVVPDTHSLVVAGGEDPGELVVEKGRSDVVDVPLEGEQTALLLVVPNLDQTVVASGYEEWELGVEVDTARWTFVTLG
jgi:hypothetical protein